MVYGMALSISTLVAKAVDAVLTSPRPKRRRGRAGRGGEDRPRRSSRSSADDSDFEDSYISDAVLNKIFKNEEREFDQYIFNAVRQESIGTQERKVLVTTAICVRDCPEASEEIALWTKYAKPVISRAPKRKRDLELDIILAEAAEEMSKYPRTSSLEDSPRDREDKKPPKPE